MKLSVLVSVYKTEIFLARCIESLARISLDSVEFIIVNDGSSSECKKIVRFFQVQLPNLHYVEHKKNLGLFEARRTGFQSAKGKYIAFLDPDDAIREKVYEKSLIVAKKLDASVVLFNAKCSDENGNEWSESYNTVPSFEGVTGRKILDKIFFQHTTSWIWHVNWNKIIRKDVLEKAYDQISSRPHLIFFEDLLLSCALYLQMLDQHCVAAIEDVGITYIRHAGSVTNSLTYSSRLKRTSDVLYVLKIIAILLHRNHAWSIYEKSYGKTLVLLLSRFRLLRPVGYAPRQWWCYLGMELRYRFLAKKVGPLINADMTFDEAEKIILGNLRKISSGDLFAIYGIGMLGQRLYGRLMKDGFRVACFITTLVRKDEVVMGSVPVRRLEEALRSGVKSIVIASVGSYSQIRSVIEAESVQSGYDVNIIGIY